MRAKKDHAERFSAIVCQRPKSFAAGGLSRICRSANVRHFPSLSVALATVWLHKSRLSGVELAIKEVLDRLLGRSQPIHDREAPQDAIPTDKAALIAFLRERITKLNTAAMGCERGW
jgi:hypothetical protein